VFLFYFPFICQIFYGLSKGAQYSRGIFDMSMVLESTTIFQDFGNALSQGLISVKIKTRKLSRFSGWEKEVTPKKLVERSGSLRVRGRGSSVITPEKFWSYSGMVSATKKVLSLSRRTRNRIESPESYSFNRFSNSSLDLILARFLTLGPIF